MNRISSEIEKKIVEMWFEGFSRDDTARSVGVSGSTVSAVVNSLPPCLIQLRDLSVALRKLGLLPVDALKGVNVLEQLAPEGVAPEQIPLYIVAFKKMSTKAGYQPEKLTKAAIKVMEFETQADKAYPEALKDFETTNSQNSELKEKNKELEETNSKLQLRIKGNKELQKHTLKQAKMAPKEISEVNALKAGLRKHEIDLHDATKLRNFLGNMKETGCDPKQFVSFTNRYGSLMASYAYFNRERLLARAEFGELQTSLPQLRAEKCRLETEVNYLRSEANSLRASANFYCTQLRNFQVAIAELERLRQEVITQIGKMLGMTDFEITNLRLNIQIHLIEAVIENKMREITKNVPQTL
jgi:chromosome segregation ATPase